MTKSEKEKALKELEQIPGVGRKISEDLWDLGIYSIAELKDKDPELLYFRLCYLAGGYVDRCILYVFRGAVY